MSKKQLSLQWQKKQLELINSEFDDLSDISDDSNDKPVNQSDFSELEPDDISTALQVCVTMLPQYAD